MVKFATPKGMRMPIGKHKGKLIEWLLLKEPFYMQVMMGRFGQDDNITIYANDRIEHFNSKPFLGKCKHENEDGTIDLLPITIMSVYVPSDIPGSIMWFCDSCWESFDKANGAPVRTYEDAILHGDTWFHRTKRATNRLLEYMYRAKGLSGKLTAKALIEFFHN